MKKLFLKTLLIIIMGACSTTSAIFDPMPGDQLWLMIDQIGLINQTIAGCVMPVTAKDIGNTGITISAPGNYAFIQDVNYAVLGLTPPPAINITTSNVALDLNNFVLSTSNVHAVLISVASGVSNVVIRNANLTGGRHSIQFGGTNSFIAVANVTALDAAQEGILIASGATYVACNQINSQGHGADGMAINGTNDNIAVFNSVFANNAGNGLTIQGNDVFIGKTWGLSNGASGLNINTGANLWMYQCRGSNNATNGINIASFTNVRASDLMTNGNATAGASCSSLTSLQLNGLNSDKDTVGLQMANNTAVTIENVIVTRSTNDGIITNGSNETDSIYRNINIYTPGTNGINISEPSAMMLMENINIFAPQGMMSFNGYGLAFQFDTSEVILRDIDILNPENHGIFFATNPPPAPPIVCTDITIDDAFVCNGATGIEFAANAQRIAITNSQCIHNVLNGVEFQATTTNLLIQNTVSMANQQRGISVDSLGARIDFDDVEIDNCFIISNTMDGIAIAGNINCSITENTIINNATNPGIAANGITAGTTTAGSFFTYIGFNDLVLNHNNATSFNISNVGSSTLFPGTTFTNGIAGNFAINPSLLENFDTTPPTASRYNDRMYITTSGWVGTPPVSHWEVVGAR
jgi:hypothetical protein